MIGAESILPTYVHLGIDLCLFNVYILNGASSSNGLLWVFNSSMYLRYCRRFRHFWVILANMICLGGLCPHLFGAAQLSEATKARGPIEDLGKWPRKEARWSGWRQQRC